MANKAAGSLWLKGYFNLNKFTLTHCSFIGNNESLEITSKGNIEQVYGKKYAPANDTALMHVEFSLKYDHLNLDFLKIIFEKIHINDIIEYIESSPSGKYERQIGFFYEFLTGNKLNLSKTISGNYIYVLDPNKYITGTVVKNTRWRINNNLLGHSYFCPIVRKTRALNELLNQNISKKIEQLKEEFSVDVFRRATNYLYNKETRSSYEIEKDQPSQDRMEKFINLLIKAGKEETSELLDERKLIQLQNAIVDKRFATSEFRNFQNYIGQTLPGYNEMIHYICPPPEILASLMEGLKKMADKTFGIYPEIRATIISFGFVFIHPFEDGNGRLHRFLIHDTLINGGAVPSGLIIPISAHMLNNLQHYDNILENYSKPLMQRLKYKQKDNGEVEVTNANEVESYFRYPDLTEQCIYLAETIHATIKEDMPIELLFIQRYDEVKKALQNIVDMPDKDINMMITYLYQNKGVFPKRRRDYFNKLTEEEILQMQGSFKKIFEIEE